MSRYYLGILSVLISAIGFGIMPFFALDIYKEGVSVSTMLFLRFALSGIILILYFGLRRISPGLSRRQAGYLLLLGVLYTLQAWFYFSAVKYISASLNVLILYIYPALIALMTRFILKEQLPVVSFLAILLSSVGLALALGASPAGINGFGVLLGIIAAFCYASYIFVSSRVVKQLSPLILFTAVAIVSAIAYLIAGLATGDLSLYLTPRAWLAVAALVLISTLMSMLLMLKGLDLIGATKASTLSMIEPLATLITSALFFGERLAATQFLGAAILIAGALIAILAKRPASESAGKETP